METEIGTLLRCLFGDDIKERQDARQKLVKIGRPVIPYMVGLQYSSQRQISSEAIKTLMEIAHPDSIPILINGLENDDPNIRWLSSEGLVKIGKPSLPPVLLALEMRGMSKYLREGSHRVLNNLKNKGIFTDTHNLIGILANPSKQMLVAPTAAIIHLNM